MRILVTGSAGFIGFHLSKSLLDDGYEVLGIDNLNTYYDPNLKYARLDQITSFKNFTFKKIDIADRESLTKVFTDFRPQKVVNLAAQAGVRYSIENPYAYMDANLVGFLNIIELRRHIEVEGLIYASSSSVYGGNKKIPFSELDEYNQQLVYQELHEGQLDGRYINDDGEIKSFKTAPSPQQHYDYACRNLREEINSANKAGKEDIADLLTAQLHKQMAYSHKTIGYNPTPTPHERQHYEMELLAV